MDWLDSLLRCALYLGIVCIAGFFVGRAIPKHWFRSNWFPFRTFSWEDGGRIYRRLAVQKWHTKVPDMSRYFNKLMPPKSLAGAPEDQQLERMVQETCVAESTHVLVSLFGFYCVRIFAGVGGWIVSLLYLMGNLPFIVIQRYNRPRLIRLREAKREKWRKDEAISNTGA